MTQQHFIAQGSGRGRRLLNRLLARWRPRRPVSGYWIVEPDVPVYDVTAFAAEIDLAALEVIRWAPVWMTRAERLALFALTFGLRPRRYLEIGTFRGGSALVVAAAMAASGNDGRLVCVDPQPQIAAEHWELLAPRTTLLQARSPAALPQAMALAGGPFDLALIDGDHTYAGVTADAEGVLAVVGEGAYLMFHDNFYGEIGAALRDFAGRHRGRVVDCGPLTREVTIPEQTSSTVYWGGLRLMRVWPRGS